VAEALLRTSDEVLEQTRRRCLVVRAVVAVALVAAVGVAVWLAGGR
jgi:hypothetical protein